MLKFNFLDIFQKYGRVLLLLCALLFSAGNPALGQVRNDFDGDGISDLTYTNIVGGFLKWQCIGSSNQSEKFNETFGLSTDFPAPGHWRTDAFPSLLVVRPNSQKKILVWKVLTEDGLIDEREFGKPGDIVLGGADFDGDGITDAAVVRPRGKRLTWEVKLGLFTGNTTKVKKFKFGRVGDRVFFMNPAGTEDWVGVAGRQGHPGIVLSTAHAGKFYDSVRAAIQRDFHLPDSLAEVLKKQGDATEIPGSYPELKKYLLEHRD